MGDCDCRVLNYSVQIWIRVFWNDTYSYGEWDWGRPVLLDCFPVPALTLVCRFSKHAHKIQKGAEHAHTLSHTNTHTQF